MNFHGFKRNNNKKLRKKNMYKEIKNNKQLILDTSSNQVTRVHIGANAYVELCHDSH